ncbi:MAG: N-methyl-L-tryptophan oxidase [Usitatibacter sp.]
MDPFDAVVLGLGAVGSASAYQLAKRGARVLGIDRFSPPHSLGSSHGDTRITRKAIGEGDAYVPLALRSHALWREIEAETGADLMTVTGGLWISSGARQAETHVANFFDNTVAAARRFGIAHEILDAAQMRRRFPQFAVRDNEVGYHEPDAGYLRPEACVGAQLRLAARHGAQLHPDERVEDFSQAQGIVTVRTERAQYRARQLIVAAGPWVRGFLPPDLARLFTVTRQVLYWFETGPPPERFVAPAFPVFIWELQERRHVIYGFPAIDGPAGGLKIATEQYAAATDADTPRREVSDAEIRAMHEQLVAPYIPGLGPRCVKAVACMYTATPDFHFVIDRLPGAANVIVASPCSGHGFKHSAAVGEAIAQLVMEGRSRIDLKPFAFSRLR